MVDTEVASDGHALVRYAKDVLDVMVASADKDGLFKGAVTHVVDDVAPARSYYSPIMNLLKSSGAIIQVRRGGGTSDSVWQIVDVDVDLELAYIQRKDAVITPIEYRMKALERKVGDIDIFSMLKGLQTDITKLESRIEQLEKGK